MSVDLLTCVALAHSMAEHALKIVLKLSIVLSFLFFRQFHDDKHRKVRHKTKMSLLIHLFFPIGLHAVWRLRNAAIWGVVRSLNFTLYKKH